MSLKIDNQEPLQLIPMERWKEIQAVCKQDWPRSIAAYKALETQVEWNKNGNSYDFRVYCPFGDPYNGMVALNEKDHFYEVIIQCPSDDTSKLENALRKTQVIDWKRDIIVPFSSRNVRECLRRMQEDIGITIYPLYSYSFCLERDAPIYENIDLSSDFTFGLLSAEHAELVNSKWHHKYPGSIKYMEQLIKADSGYGLFKFGELVSWAFVGEAGNITHMYTIEPNRGKGFAKLLLKLVTNILLKESKDVIMYCVRENDKARNFYTKMGFEITSDNVAWLYLKPK